mmetsp:Transcript_797/g.992  ORF Transcript_797/g.992 Transcript_797/m.992 type:complete len:305 (+) Transcript_797:467-1381(+)
MVSILSFDSRSMEYLLDDQFQEYFDKRYPIFYKNKVQKGPVKDQKYFYRSAIDNALRNNQVKAVGEIIKYIVKYQNNFSSSYLFLKNLPDIIDKGIEVKALFDSEIFCYDFDYDEWPGTHTNDSKVLRPYNDSIYVLRRKYKSVFKEKEFEDIHESEDGVQKDISSDKIYKIKYSIILLPLIGQHIGYDAEGNKELQNDSVSFLGLCTDSDELEIFECNSLNEMIEFKWNQFGFRHHLISFLIHAIQMGFVIAYVQIVYLSNSLFDWDAYNADNSVLQYKQNGYAIFLLVGILYPFIYECIQAY